MLLPHLRRLAPVGLALTALPACVLFVLALCQLPHQEREASARVAHTLGVLAQAATLEADLAKVGRGAQDVLANRTDNNLQRFDAASRVAANDLAALRALTADNPVQQAALDRLDPLAMTRIVSLRGIVESAGASDENSIPYRAWQRTRVVTDQIQGDIASMKAEEQRLLAQHKLDARRAARRTLAVVVGCGVLVVINGVLALVLLARRRRARALAERERAHVAELQEANASLEILNGLGTVFAELDQERLVEAIVGAAMRLTGSTCAALFERVAPERNGGAEAWHLSSLAGAPRDAFTRFGLPRATALFGPTFRAEGVVRSDDVLADPRYGAQGGMPAGHPPIRSYLAVPVVSRTGETLGALLFGHAEPCRFSVREEMLIVGLAGQAAAALDNARLFQAVQEERAEAAALAAEREATLGQLAEGVIVADREGRIVFVNEAAERLHGGSYLGVAPGEYSKAYHLLTEDGRMPYSSLELPLARAVLRGEAVSDARWRIRRPDGAEMIVIGSARPIRDAGGAQTGAVLVMRDDTARFAAEVALERHRDELERLVDERTAELVAGEARLRESEARFRLLAEHASDMVSHVGPDGTRLYASPAAARIFGVTPEALVQGGAVYLVHPDDQDAVVAMQERLLAGTSETETLAFRILNPERGEVWIEASACALRDPITGAPGGYVNVKRDVTERHRLAEEREAYARELERSNAELERLARHLVKARDAAEQANQAKSRFLAATSHELRTPLNGILGYAQILRLEGGLSAAQDARVDAMLGAGAHLLEMINRVLDLSEVEAGRVELRVSEIDLGQLAGACLNLVRPGAAAKGLALSLDAAPDASRRITTDPTRLCQVLVNLLGNAVKFTTQGTVALRLRRAAADDTGAVRIEVADTGPGIPTKRRHRLFQDFERLDVDKVGRVEGAGLGLALSARLAALLGGHLGHEDNPGGGSVFWLELPLILRAGTDIVPGPIADNATSPDASGTARSLRVLVVDDVAMNRDIASTFLRAAGHEVTCAEDGAGAVAAAMAGDYDAVLMDVRMPEMDGLEATRRIRALPGPRGRVPVVALTAQAFAEQVAECQAAGMDSHLSKPFAPEALLAAVTRAVTIGQVHGDAAACLATPHLRSAAVPAVAAPIGAELTVFDQVAFERTAAFLSPEAVTSYLRIIAERCAALRRELDAADALVSGAGNLAEAAHTLAGSAGMFGLERLATVARRFECALQAGAADMPVLAAALAAAIDASLEQEALGVAGVGPERGCGELVRGHV